jgi:hypothetical protein
VSALRREDNTIVPPGDVAAAVRQTNDAAEDRAAAEKSAKSVESLDDRIERAERRIAKHRLVLAARTGDVTGKVRGKLGSPMLVVIAAGAGFLFAQFRKRRGKDEVDRRDRPEVVMRPSMFATLTDALTLATTLLAMMPLIRSKAKEGVQEATGEVPPSS